MLDLSTAVLCDFAQVRDRLLFVSSGAVSRLYRQELPSPLGLMVGLVIEVPLEDAGLEHRLRAEVINRHGTVLATLENVFRVSDVGLFPHEVQQVPLVLSITGVRARTWGTHQVRLYLDDDLVRALTLYVVPATGAQGTVRTTPTQSRVADDEGSLGAVPADADADANEPITAQPVPAFATAGEGGGDTGAAPEGEPAPVTADDEPAPAEPAAAEEWAPGSSVSWGVPSDPEPEIELDLDPVLDLAIEMPGEPAPMTDPAPEPDAPAGGAPEPARVAWRTPIIDAAPATDDSPDTAAVPQVFDFEDADPDSGPEGDGDGDGDRVESSAKEPSRFAFRYRYEDDEET